MEKYEKRNEEKGRKVEDKVLNETKKGRKKKRE